MAAAISVSWGRTAGAVSAGQKRKLSIGLSSTHAADTFSSMCQSARQPIFRRLRVGRKFLFIFSRGDCFAPRQRHSKREADNKANQKQQGAREQFLIARQVLPKSAWLLGRQADRDTPRRRRKIELTHRRND